MKLTGKEAAEVYAARKQERERNREAMPNVAEVIDTFNRFFGPVRVLGAEDKVTGKKVGSLPDG